MIWKEWMLWGNENIERWSDKRGQEDAPSLSVVWLRFTWLHYNSINLILPKFLLIQFSSVAQSCPTLCDPMNRSMPGLPVHHQLPEFTQTHVHRVSDAIQPSHPLSSPSPPALNLSQHQGLVKWVSSLHQVAQSTGVSASASVFPMNTQVWSPLGWTCWLSLQSKGLSRAFSNTTVQKHQFFSAQLSLWSNSHIHTYMTTGKTVVLIDRPLLTK